MAPRDGDENGIHRRPRQNPAPPAVADGSDGEEDDIVDDDINEDDIAGNDEEGEDNSEDDSEDMDSDEAEAEAEDDEDPDEREFRLQRLRTENAELTAERLEAHVTLGEERDLTERIREDVRRIEAQRNALIEQRERDLAELARIQAAAAQGVDPPPLPPKPDEQSNQQEEAGAGANPDANPDPSPSGSG